ncbi:hypothetical protein ACFLV1_03020 [Chloroflexota bacterium]
MATSPISPSKFHMVIRELGAVKTRGGFAALNLGLLFLAFFFALFLGKDMDISQLITVLLILAIWQVFAFWAVGKLPEQT